MLNWQFPAAKSESGNSDQQSEPLRAQAESIEEVSYFILNKWFNDGDQVDYICSATLTREHDCILYTGTRLCSLNVNGPLWAPRMTYPKNSLYHPL